MSARIRRLLPLALAVAGVLPYLPTLAGQFVNWDDPVNFLNNEGYRGLGPAQLRWMFTSTLLGHYIPLTWLTLGLNYAVGGMNPWGYHLGNLLLHGAAVALFYLVARRLLAAGFGESRLDAPAMVAGAAFAALAFGVHPLRAESVAWLTERRDVLCAVFYLLAVLAYLRGADRGSPVHGRWRALSVAAFAAALLSKAMAMTLPATLLLLDVYPLRRTRLGWRALVREKAAYLALAAAGAVVAVVAVSRGAVWTGYQAYGPGARLAMTAYAIWFYPSRFVWAQGLSPLYELPLRIDPLEPRFLGPITAMVAVTAVLVAARRAFPAGLTAWLHSAIVLSPVSGVVHAGHQLAHDRYSYLSGLGFALLVGAGLSWAIRAQRRGAIAGWAAAAVAVAGVAVVLGWGAMASAQGRIWLTSESLWRAAVAVEPDCGICRNSLGIAIARAPGADARSLAAAEAEFRQAVALRPVYPDAHANLAAVLVLQRRPAEAEPVLRAFVQSFPRLPDGPLRLGMLLCDTGRAAEGIPMIREALRMSPDYTAARRELGRALANQGGLLLEAGRPAEAIPRFQEATTLLPGDALPLRNLGHALVEARRYDEAIAPLESAVALAPRDASVRALLVRAQRGAGAPAAAEPHLRVLCELGADARADCRR